MLDQSTIAIDNKIDPRTSKRRAVFRMLETAKEHDLSSKLVDLALITLIAMSVILVVLESLPAFEARFSEQLFWFEVITVAIFTVEYVLRIWSSVERHDNFLDKPFLSRIRYMFSFHLIIDLLAILPFYLLSFGLLGAIDLRFLRAVRLLRVLKLTRYSGALNMLVVTFSENGRALAASFLILVTVMLLAASGMYYFERHAQPVAFGSIPASMWWAFSTLTTVGYGDVTPTTVGGKIFGALITVVGIVMVALPTSILASGYSQQLNLRQATYRNRTNVALDDGVLCDDELKDLEELRINLGLSKNSASQILDAGIVEAALKEFQDASCCPHCGHQIPN